ncbi:MAG: AzlD domain-containing protein [Eubacterium sp.]|nr:AzlD domain-containing protein [Eubacterium sp.]
MDIKLFFIYLFLMAFSTYLIRAVPFVAVKNKIKNRFVLSFLSYIPYAVLTAMTIPAILYATGDIITAAVGTVAAIIMALTGAGLMPVAVVSCLAVYLTDLVMSL